jgi:hypothetical protein
MTDTPVVVAAHMLIAGLVVRWYRSENAADINRVVISASRDGVMIHGDVFLHDLPVAWLTAAGKAHEAIAAGRDDDARAFATHERKGFMNGPLVAVQR